MAGNDRSVGLSELAARTQNAHPGGSRRSRSDCKNPEGDGGLTPGLVAAGGGSKSQPLFGAGGVGAKKLMRWGWVPCLVCNPTDDQRRAGARYKELHLSDAQIAQRAELASRKATYQPREKDLAQTTLGRPGQPLHPPSPAQQDTRLAELLEQNKQLNARIAEMMAQNAEMLKSNAEMTQTLSRMSMQVASLLEDNAKLRAEQAAKAQSSLEYSKQRAQSSAESLRSVLGAASEPRIEGTLSLPDKGST